MYTANTMACAIEALGMSLPYSSSSPADSDVKARECGSEAGAAMRRLLELDLKPRDIMTRAAFGEEARGAAAAAAQGSHRLLRRCRLAQRTRSSSSWRSGAPRTLCCTCSPSRTPSACSSPSTTFRCVGGGGSAEWCSTHPCVLPRVQRVSDRTPLLANLKPSGKFVMEDMQAVGGTPVRGTGPRASFSPLPLSDTAAGVPAAARVPDYFERVLYSPSTPCPSLPSCRPCSSTSSGRACWTARP